MKKHLFSSTGLQKIARTAALIAGVLSTTHATWALALTKTQAQEKIRALLALPVSSNLVAAPDNPSFAWVEKRSGVRNIFIASDKTKPKQATNYSQDDGTDLWGLSFSVHGKILAYVEGGDPEYPDDPAPDTGFLQPASRQNVHVILPNGKNITLGEGWNPVFSPTGTSLAFARMGTITVASLPSNTQSTFSVKGTVDSLSWSPNGHLLAFTIHRDAHSFIGTWDATSKKLEILDPTLSQDSLPTFSPDGKRVAFIREHPPLLDNQDTKASFWSLYIYNLEHHTGQSIWAAPAGAGARFSAPEGGRLLWSDNTHVLFPWEGSGWMRICSLALSESTPHCLTPDHAEISAYTLSPDLKILFYTSNVENLDAWHAWKLTLNTSTPERLTHDDQNMETDLAVSNNAVAVLTANAKETTHPVLVTDTQNPISLAGMPSQLTQNFIQPQTVIFQSQDGTPVHGQLFLPKTNKLAQHPALIFVHGGPERQMLPAFNSMGYYSNAYIMKQVLADQGYVVLAINYRSGTGYGEAFRNAHNTGRQGAAEYQDVLSAALWLQKKPEVNPQRLGIWGGSWGGYLTALALARNSDVFKAGADFHGVHDMVEPDVFGLSPEQNRTLHDIEWKSSPAADITHWHSPVLLVHGDDDYNVEFRQSVLLSRMLTTQGVPYEEHAFPNERHAFLRTKNWLSAYVWMDMFFNKTLPTTQH